MRPYPIILIYFILLSCSGDEDNALSNNLTVSTLSAKFNGSGGVAVDAAGNIYVGNFGDQLNNANGTTVTKFSPTGESSLFASGLNGASGNAFDSKGNLFQANIRGNSISKIEPDGTISIFASTDLQSPVGIAIDKNDNLYVCNCGGNSITKVNPSGQSEIFVQSSLFACPNGLAIDDQGNLYPTNFNNGSVLKVTPAGEVSILADLEKGRNAHITFTNNKLYAVSRNTGRIFEVTLEGEFKVIAGTGKFGNDDGPALESTFFTPNGISASPDGTKLYVTSKIVGTGTQLNPVALRVINIAE